MVKIVIAVVVAVIVFGLGSQVLKAVISNQLVNAVAKNDKKTFYRKIDTFLTKFLIPPFKREYMRLCMLFMEGDKIKIEEQLEMCMKMRLTAEDSLDVHFKAFYFYVDCKNKVKANEVLRKIRTMVDDENYRQIKLIYDIELDKSSAYIEAMEELVKREKGYDAGLYYYYLGVQYNTIGKIKMSQERFKLALKELKGTPYEVKIKKYLK